MLQVDLDGSCDWRLKLCDSNANRSVTSTLHHTSTPGSITVVWTSFHVQKRRSWKGCVEPLQSVRGIGKPTGSTDFRPLELYLLDSITWTRILANQKGQEINEMCCAGKVFRNKRTPHGSPDGGSRRSL